MQVKQGLETEEIHREIHIKESVCENEENLISITESDQNTNLYNDNQVKGDEENTNNQIEIKNIHENFTSNQLTGISPIKEIFEKEDSKSNDIIQELSLPQKEEDNDEIDLNQSNLELKKEIFEYYDKYSCVRKEERLVNKKMNMLQEEVLNNLGEFNFKKNYSRLEKEKIELERMRLCESKEHDKAFINESGENLNTGNKLSQADTLRNNFGTFMSDAKIHKSKLEQTKEAAKENKLIGIKRENEISDQFNYSVKKQKTSFEEDWSTLMSNSVKKKPQIQLDKEKFLEECKKRREESLKNKNILAKSHVMKFDIPGTESEEINPEEKVLDLLPSLGHSKICVICEGPVEHNFKKLAVRCEHVAHMVLLYKFRNVG
jgi:hypothetical protein